MLVRRLRQRAEDAQAQMHSELIPLAEAIEQQGTRFPAAVARLGADVYAYAEQALARLEAQLQQQARPTHPGPSDEQRRAG